MKKFYEESWFKRLGLLICALLLILSFSIHNLLALVLPFVLVGIYGVVNPGEDADRSFFIRVFSAMLALPFGLAAVALIAGAPRGLWFSDYSSLAWAVIFNGALIYAAAVFLAGVLLWIFREQRGKKGKQGALEALSFVMLEPRQPSLVQNLPKSEVGCCRKAIVIPINKKTAWVRLPCHLINQGSLPVVALGIEALNPEITGTSALEHPLLLPVGKRVGIDLYVPVTEARHLEILCRFTNVLGESTTGILSLVQSGGLYYGAYNLNRLD
ncbi:MAG: hypothetical protein Q4C55_09625 [Eubacterium sp.]|nr:hypothetical protein [Eubacterium sp.]